MYITRCKTVVTISHADRCQFVVEGDECKNIGIATASVSVVCEYVTVSMVVRQEASEIVSPESVNSPSHPAVSEHIDILLFINKKYCCLLTCVLKPMHGMKGTTAHTGCAKNAGHDNTGPNKVVKVCATVERFCTVGV